jgi:hypothetical protein
MCNIEVAKSYYDIMNNLFNTTCYGCVIMRVVVGVVLVGLPNYNNISCDIQTLYEIRVVVVIIPDNAVA